jgi:hypothetical protein
MRYIPATGQDGLPLTVIDPETGQQIIGPVDISPFSPLSSVALRRLVESGDLVLYTDPPPKKTMKGE